jgi:hypothetical protein
MKLSYALLPRSDERASHISRSLDLMQSRSLFSAANLLATASVFPALKDRFWFSVKMEISWLFMAIAYLQMIR